MSKTFREWTLDQALLLPPSVHDFVPAGHLSRFVVALVTEELDLSTIMASYKGEKGQPPYHPAMMVALLLYSYAVGLYSSRRIAKACMERVDFMAIVALQAPDFRTISEFRRRHLAALSAELNAIVEAWTRQRSKQQLARALLLSFEQPHVLDCDHRLVGEGGHQLDLLLRKWPHCATRENEDADRRAFAHERNGEHGAKTRSSLHFPHREFRIGQNILDLYVPRFENRAPGNRAAPHFDLNSPDHLPLIERQPEI